MADPKEKFFRHFQAEIIREFFWKIMVYSFTNTSYLSVLQDEIDNLVTVSSSGGERQIGIEAVLSGISRLSHEVMDAADYIPSYDQRAYSQVSK